MIPGCITPIARIARIATLALVLCTGACVLSVDEVVPAGQAQFDARLLGAWQPEDGAEVAVFSRMDSATYEVAYTRHDTTGIARGDGRTGYFGARIGMLGAHRVLDVWPTPRSGQLPDAYDGSFIAGHLLFLVDLRGDELHVRALESDTLRAALRRGKVRLTYSATRDQVVLKGSTAELRAALAPYLSRAGVLGETTVFRRVRGTQP